MSHEPVKSLEVIDEDVAWGALAAMVFAVMLLGSLARADDANGKEQIWEGKIKVREGVELRLVVRRRSARPAKWRPRSTALTKVSKD